MTLKMTSAKVVETTVIVNNNCYCQQFFSNYTNPRDYTRQAIDHRKYRFSSKSDIRAL